MRLRSRIIFLTSGTHDPQFVPHFSLSCNATSIASGALTFIPAGLSNASLISDSDTLKQLLRIVQNTGTDLKAHADRVREFMRLGTREREERLAYHINRLQPANETMKKDLLQQFRFIMQSLALYRSDLRKADFKPTESSEEELIYLRKKLPELIESLKNLASLRKATD